MMKLKRLVNLRFGARQLCVSAGLAMVVATGFSIQAGAETFEIKMLNRGEKGSMVFEPDFLEIAPGDRVRFVPSHKSHNAATIDGMVPEDIEGFKSRINDEFETGFESRALRHQMLAALRHGHGYADQGGDAVLPQSYRTVEVLCRAKPRIEELFERAEK